LVVSHTRSPSKPVILAIIAKMTGFEGDLVWDTTKPNGQPRRALDTSRAKNEFGFEAHTDFDEGLQNTVDWYLQHRK